VLILAQVRQYSSGCVPSLDEQLDQQGRQEGAATRRGARVQTEHISRARLRSFYLQAQSDTTVRALEATGRGLQSDLGPVECALL
jgi:hypothetical protein